VRADRGRWVLLNVATPTEPLSEGTVDLAIALCGGSVTRLMLGVAEWLTLTNVSFQEREAGV